MQRINISAKAKRLYTPAQVASILQLHVLTIYQYIREKKLTAVKLGRSYRIDEKDLKHFIHTHKQ